MTEIVIDAIMFVGALAGVLAALAWAADKLEVRRD